MNGPPTPLPEPDLRSGAAMWSAYVAAHPEHEGDLPPVEAFGDSAELADELLALVLVGTKRATAAMVADYESEDEPLPAAGVHWVVTDGTGAARAVLRSHQVRVGRLDSVDDAFAHDEGEGDRSRAWWLDAHLRFVGRRCAALGLPDQGPATRMVFERFAVVWPPELADAEPG